MSRYEKPDMMAATHSRKVKVYKRVAKLTEEDGQTVILLKAGWIFPAGQSKQAFQTLHQAMVGIHAAVRGTPAPPKTTPLVYMDMATLEERLAALQEVGRCATDC